MPGRPGSKSYLIQELLGRQTGATIKELAAATSWQDHSVRGFMSGTLKKKLGLAVTTQIVDGVRHYRLGNGNCRPVTMLTVKLKGLEDLGLADLRSTWAEYYGTSPPASMSKELLRLAIGYKMQEEVSGGLSRRTLLQLSSLASAPAGKRHTEGSSQRPVPKAGTKLIREWQGKVHEVLALEDGQFACGGKTYPSLTVIARQITGTHQSGPRFFGLKSNTSIVSVKGNSDG